jgi:hypothetical protein
MLGITFIVSNHSLFDIGDDLRSNPFKKIRNYKNQQATPYDLLYVLIGPITRAKAKRINKYSIGLFKNFEQKEL